MNNKQALQKRVQTLKDNLDKKYPTPEDHERFKYSKDYVGLKGKYQVALKELERLELSGSTEAASAGLV